MPITAVTTVNPVTSAQHLANMRTTTLVRKPHVRPFQSPAVDISSQRIKPAQLAITSKYVLSGQVRLLVEELFPKLIEKGVNPFNMEGSVHVIVERDDLEEPIEVDFAAPVCEVLESRSGSGEKVTAIADGMMRYTIARLIAEAHPDFKMRCTVIDQTALDTKDQVPFYADINDWSEVSWSEIVPPWRDRKTYVDAEGNPLELAGLPEADVEEAREAVYARYRVYVGGSTMPRTEGQDFGPGFESAAELRAALEELYVAVQQRFGLEGVGLDGPGGSELTPSGSAQ